MPNVIRLNAKAEVWIIGGNSLKRYWTVKMIGQGDLPLRRSICRIGEEQQLRLAVHERPDLASKHQRFPPWVPGQRKEGYSNKRPNSSVAGVERNLDLFGLSWAYFSLPSINACQGRNRMDAKRAV